jgi:hypothetical protein
MTSFDAVDILYAHLQTHLMTHTGKPSGKLYRFKRPLNSSSEDVVVNALPISYGKLQEAVLNVNLHVPNLTLGADQTQPNAKRLKELAGITTALLKRVTGDGYRLDIDQERLFEDTSNSHYVNLRILFHHTNC